MITILTNRWLNKRLPVLIYILIFPLTMFLSGCYTTKTEMVMDEQIPVRLSRQAEKDIKIVSLKLKNGSIISIKNKDAKFLLDYKGMKNVIYYSTADTINTAVGHMKLVYTDSIIQLKDIKYAKIEISKLDGVKTVLVVVGVAALVLLILVIVGAAVTLLFMKQNMDNSY